MRKSSGWAVLLLAFAARAGAATWYVATNGLDTADGTNWATAKASIQAAIDAAAANDTVIVSNGNYDTGGRTLTGFSLTNRIIIDKPITVQSVSGPDVTYIYGAYDPNTFSNGDAAVRCAYVTNGATLQGFTLYNGNTRTAGFPDGYGGGVFCEPGATVSNCRMTICSAGDQGGGAYEGALYNCVLKYNKAVYGGGGASGGVLNNCLLTDNQADLGGGAFSCTLNNCTVVGNGAWSAGGGTYGGNLNNCIVYFNTSLSGDNYALDIFYNSCTTPDPGIGLGNITNDPQFASAFNGNFRLLPSSPCIDAGSNAFTFGSTDLAGYPRIFNRRVDMGAYEAGAIASANGGGIEILDRTNAAPYPSIITVGGVTNAVANLRVRLNGFSHTYPGDVDIFLVSPSGRVCGVMSDAGGSNVANSVNLTFDDDAPALIPFASALTDGIFIPANYDSSEPVPPGGIGTIGSLLNELHTDGVNGDWKLYVSDDSTFDAGSIASWALDFEWYFDAPTYYASLSNSTPVFPYVTWTNAAGNIQDAIDAAAVDDTVLVSNGVYQTGGRVRPGQLLTNRVVIDKPVFVRSVNGPGVTVIRGAKDPLTTNGNAAVRCVWTTNGATLVGFTLTNGATRRGGEFVNEQSGGGLLAWSASDVVSNCVFSGNSASGNAGGAYKGMLNNCTLSGNSAGFNGGGTYLGTLNNCIVYSNLSGGNYVGGNINYSCTTPLPPSGTGNITNDPQFVNADAGDYQLSSASPCIDLGNNLSVTGTTDLNGNPRIVNIVVDMGAYEFQGVANPDYDGDGWVNADEYIADTDPRNGASFFPRAALGSAPAGQMSFEITGSSAARLYGLYRNTNLLATPQSWTLVPPEQSGGAAVLTLTITNTLPAANYRTGVRLP